MENRGKKSLIHTFLWQLNSDGKEKKETSHQIKSNQFINLNSKFLSRYLQWQIIGSSKNCFINNKKCENKRINNNNLIIEEIVSCENAVAQNYCGDWRNYLSLIVLAHWNHPVFPHLIILCYTKQGSVEIRFIRIFYINGTHTCSLSNILKWIMWLPEHYNVLAIIVIFPAMASD